MVCEIGGLRWMNLIYYYPHRNDAPAKVGKMVFKHLIKRKDDLPFDDLKLFTSPKYVEHAQKEFCDVEIITYKNLCASKDDVVHIPISPGIMPNSKFLLHLYSIFRKMPLILQYHGDIRKATWLKLKYEHAINIFEIPTFVGVSFLLKSANVVITHSYSMSDLIRNQYNIKNEIVIPNGIDDFWFEDSAMESNVGGEPAIFYHGRLSAEKGVDLLINGFSKATDINSKAKLYIAGDGPLRKQLEKLCIKLGVEKNVIFLGYVDSNNLKSYLKNVDAAVYPSRFESFSLAILEAFGFVNGPVYYSSFAGINDFVVQNGYTLNAFEPTIENISTIVEDILLGNHDTQMIKQQKEFSKLCTWDKIINSYIQLYSDLFKPAKIARRLD